jgi:predicted nucleic acid-binding protein
VKVILDINILLDVFQKRRLHYIESIRALSIILAGGHTGLLPGHAVTTVYYILSKHAHRKLAEEAIDMLLTNFEIAAVDSEIFRRARNLPMKDFEDAVVAALAEKAGCDAIVTRNVDDFISSPVTALTPGEFIGQLTSG